LSDRLRRDHIQIRIGPRLVAIVLEAQRLLRGGDRLVLLLRFFSEITQAGEIVFDFFDADNTVWR
jgi:hypothetical protein